jgi:hypothetical protein
VQYSINHRAAALSQLTTPQTEKRRVLDRMTHAQRELYPVDSDGQHLPPRSMVVEPHLTVVARYGVQRLDAERCGIPASARRITSHPTSSFCNVSTLHQTEGLHHTQLQASATFQPCTPQQ